MIGEEGWISHRQMFFSMQTAIVSFSASTVLLYSLVFSRNKRTAFVTEEMRVSCFAGSIMSELWVRNTNFPVVVWRGDSSC